MNKTYTYDIILNKCDVEKKMTSRYCERCGKSTAQRVFFTASYTMIMKCVKCGEIKVANNENNFLVG